MSIIADTFDGELILLPRCQVSQCDDGRHTLLLHCHGHSWCRWCHTVACHMSRSIGTVSRDNNGQPDYILAPVSGRWIDSQCMLGVGPYQILLLVWKCLLLRHYAKQTRCLNTVSRHEIKLGCLSRLSIKQDHNRQVAIRIFDNQTANWFMIFVCHSNSAQVWGCCW